MGQRAGQGRRDFVRRAVRRNVLEWKEFRRGDTALMAAEARIPDADLEHVIELQRLGNEVRSLHEGNAIDVPRRQVCPLF